MPLPFMGCGGGLVSFPDPIIANWGSITTEGNGDDGTNSDVALNFKVGANRRIRGRANTGVGANATLYYRINSGSWVSYLALTASTVTTGALITVTPTQTVGWRVVHSSGSNGNSEVTITDYARSETIDLFAWAHSAGP